jgi:hypothetical protein
MSHYWHGAMKRGAVRSEELGIGMGNMVMMMFSGSANGIG